MRTCFIVLVLFVIVHHSFGQNSYFVSPYGNNGTTGSFSEPWNTIQFGMDQLSPGDSLFIMQGVYAEKLILNNSGLNGQIITIKSFQNDEVIVDADQFNNEDPIFYTNNKSAFRLEGINFTNCYSENGFGLLVEGYGHDIEVVDCSFSNIAISRDMDAPVSDDTNQPVISFFGNSVEDSLTNILVDQCEIYNCRPGFSECLTVSGNATDFVFSRNRIYDNANIGIDATGNYGVCANPVLDHARRGLIKENLCYNNISDYASSAGIYVDGGSYIVIENNISHDNGFGAEVGCEEAGFTNHVVVRNNLFYNNLSGGIALGGYDESTGGYVTNSRVSNNTFYKNDRNGEYTGELFFSQFEDGVITNNIFYLSEQNFLMYNERDQPGLIMDYNLVFSEDGETSIEAYWDDADYYGFADITTIDDLGPNFVFDDPGFVNGQAADYHILPGSAAIDSGDPNYMPGIDEVDIDGDPRIIGGTVDLGADEYNNTVSSPQMTNQLPPVVFPNPSNGVFYIKGIQTNSHLVLTDRMGQSIPFRVTENGQSGVDVSTHKNNIFFLIYNTGRGVVVTKLIVTKTD